MSKVNGKIYYNNVTGVVLLVLYQNDSTWIRETTLEEDIIVFDELKKVNRNVISVKRLEWDQHKEDFMTQQAVKVVNGRIQWQPNPPPEVPPQDKSFSEKLADAEKELARQKELNTMMNNDFSELVNYLAEAGVL